MSRNAGARIGGGGEGGFVGCYERETSHGSIRVDFVNACANGIVDRVAGAVGAWDLCEFEFEDFGGHGAYPPGAFGVLLMRSAFGLSLLILVSAFSFSSAAFAVMSWSALTKVPALE